MSNTVNATPTVQQKKASLGKNIFTSYLNYTQRQEKHKMFWYILGLVFIPCVAIILSVFAMYYLQFPYLAFYMASTFLMYYAIVVAHLTGTKALVYISLFFLNILYLIGTPLIVLLFN